MSTEVARPAAGVLLEEGGSKDRGNVGLWTDVTLVLSVSCSERIGIVDVVLSGTSGFVEAVLVYVAEGVVSVFESEIGSVLEGVEVGSAEVEGDM